MFSGKMEFGAHSSDKREFKHEVHGKRQNIELLPFAFQLSLH